MPHNETSHALGEGKNIELVFTCWIKIEAIVTMCSVTASHSQSRLAITMVGVPTASKETSGGGGWFVGVAMDYVGDEKVDTIDTHHLVGHVQFSPMEGMDRIDV